MKMGFAKVDITPRVGVELCGFGPFLMRRSATVRDRLWARAMAVERDGMRMLLVSCDLIGVTAAITGEVRGLVREATGIGADAVMLHCTHTHSGPSLGAYIGWGEADEPYVQLLPRRIARACTEALDNLQEAVLSHAEMPCEGIGINREHDKDVPPLEEALHENWRPARPQLTDTTCHVLKAEHNGEVIGFLSYFGCHPVVCCEATRQVHGDYCGVATNMLERENPGAVGLFLQGAHGDVNSCVAHKSEPEAIPALNVIASRYARAVRTGLAAAEPLEVDSIACARREVVFHRRLEDREKLCDLLVEKEAVIHAPGAADADTNVRMAVVYAVALRKLIAAMDAGETLEPAAELQSLRVGPVAFLGAPLEIFQAIKNEVVKRAVSPIPLVMSLTNDNLGYAVDKTVAARGGYAADFVPFICGALPFADIEDELVQSLLDLNAALS